MLTHKSKSPGPHLYVWGDTGNYQSNLPPHPSFYTYHWSVTGGYLNFSNQNTANVTWTIPGTGIVKLELIEISSGLVTLSDTMHVNVLKKPKPLIFDTAYNFGGSYNLQQHPVFCADEFENDQLSPEGHHCDAVCEGSTMNYITKFNKGSTYSWTVFGYCCAGPPPQPAPNQILVNLDNSDYRLGKHKCNRNRF